MPARRQRAPMHHDDTGQPVTRTTARIHGGRGAARRRQAQREAEALRQPANSGRFAATAVPGGDPPATAKGARFAATGERRAFRSNRETWEDAVSEMVARAEERELASLRMGATATAGMWNVVACWLRGQADLPPGTGE